MKHANCNGIAPSEAIFIWRTLRSVDSEAVCAGRIDVVSGPLRRGLGKCSGQTCKIKLQGRLTRADDFRQRSGRAARMGPAQRAMTGIQK